MVACCFSKWWFCVIFGGCKFCCCWICETDDMWDSFTCVADIHQQTICDGRLNSFKGRRFLTKYLRGFFSLWLELRNCAGARVLPKAKSHSNRWESRVSHFWDRYNSVRRLIFRRVRNVTLRRRVFCESFWSIASNVVLVVWADELWLW